VIAGVERKAHYLAMDLPQSDDCFVMAFPAETTEAFLEGHNHAFAYFGGVPRTILYDNTKVARRVSGPIKKGSPETHPRAQRTESVWERSR
jgi:transposase